MTDQQLRDLLFKVIRNYLSNHPDKVINLYYRFNPELHMRLGFKGLEPMLNLDGQLVPFNSAKNSLANRTNTSQNQNPYINLSFLLSEITEIEEFQNFKLKAIRSIFSNKINYFASEYYNWIRDKPQYVKIESSPIEFANKIESDNNELIYLEGKIKYSIHIRKERNKEVVKLKKKLAFELNPLLPCEICKTSFQETYGDVGKGFIEAHHILPISYLTEETQTCIDDFILVCSNCHKIIHRKRPWLTLEQIIDLLK